MESVGGLANAFYIIGIGGVAALALLALWMVLSPSFRETGQ
jgi:hypothetical protein